MDTTTLLTRAAGASTGLSYLASDRHESALPETDKSNTNMPFQPIVPPSQQLAFWNWSTDSGDAEEVTIERYIAGLERDAEAAMFDWIECRRTPQASTLWSVFAHKASLLEQALSGILKPRSSLWSENK